ncbi:site-specific DNA-methyltransferase [Corynebacterium renale]|uniref:site-specific DNA-methyltransferase n=1 Tax=Corynebacterium renale TaxID=1724 RepID=UPI0021615E22|nr:site-specific DNA-methyltransferase [Corynebacterium renale]
MMNEEHEMINEVPSSSPEFRTELAEKLANLAPEAVADGKIDVEKLKELLEGDASDTSERFGLFWPGKKRAMRAAHTPTTATLKPDKANSKVWDTTKNVFIEGDNLEVLKILQKHYHGKIKMIYIDPPYNTGKDFVYPDNYKEGLETYLEWSKQVNEEGQKLSSNAESEGRYHSNWLNMMYPRLKLARNLLTIDGLIFISISDHEYAHLKKMLDEVFGEINFEGSIHWRRRHNQPNDKTKLIGLVAEHILVYARNSTSLKAIGVGKLPLTGKFTNPDNDPRGPWNSKPWKVGSGQGGSTYSITTPTGHTYTETWMGEKATFDRLLNDGRIIFTKSGEGLPRKKQFKSERLAEGQAASNWFSHEQFGSNQEGSTELENLFDGTKSVFDNPKPTKLIKNLVMLGNLKDEDLILDFFAGSGTTADAVMRLNAEDGGNENLF